LRHPICPLPAHTGIAVAAAITALVIPNLKQIQEAVSRIFDAPSFFSPERVKNIPIDSDSLSGMSNPLLSELTSLYDRAHSLIQKELKLAEAEGKKLLIGVGENHEEHDSLISELMVGLASHSLGIHDILTETVDRSHLDKIITKPFNLKKQFLNYQILLPILLKMGVNIYSVDPFGSKDIRIQVASEIRNPAINNEIASLNSNSHSIFFGGAGHLMHLANDNVLQAKYRLLPINTVPVTGLKGLMPDKMSRWIEDNCAHFLYTPRLRDLSQIFQAMSQLPAIQQNNELTSAFQKFGSSSLKIIHPHLDLIDLPSNSIEIQHPDFIKNFEQNKPFQIQLVNVMHQFYTDCSKDEYQGLIVYGDPGTGKTHCSNDIVAKLKNQGKRIVTADFHSPLLSEDRYIKILEKYLNLDKKEMMIDEIISIFEHQWKSADLFFVDDTNEHVSVLTDVTSAMFTYAERTKKKILVSANTSPFETVKTKRHSWDFGGRLRILEVRGEDYRKEQAWHKNIQPLPIDLSTDTSWTWTPEQKEIISWIQALKIEQGECGLFIAGSPGTGKTTAIRKALKNENTLWLSSDMMERDALQSLPLSDFEFLVIEDLNDFGLFNSPIESIISELLNKENIKNAKGRHIKTILTSNTPHFAKRLKGVIAFAELSDRMESRFLKKFKELTLQSTIDFRTPNASMGIIMGLNDNHNTLMRPGMKIYEFSLEEFNSSLDRFVKQNQYTKRGQYRDNVKNQAIEADCIIVKWDDKPYFGFENRELPLFLELMENKNKQLIFKTESPTTFQSELNQLMNNPGMGVLGTFDPKSLSRIKRLVTI
jgi:Cdc6-like AAA superfamily ATPase